MTRWRHLTARSTAWAWALAGALLLAQALGLAHRVVHAPGAPGAPEAKAAFAGHAAGDADCRLLDALSAADGLPAAAADAPPRVPATPPGVPAPAVVATAHAGAPYQARAPPQG